jgi:mono/diheme cytochrome c family protein
MTLSAESLADAHRIRGPFQPLDKRVLASWVMRHEAFDIGRILMPALAALTIAWLTSCSNVPGMGATTAREPGRSQEKRNLDAGERLYEESCAGCHGASAGGTGPAAPLLGAPVPDLTRLASRRGGSFPVDEIYRVIDGQADLTALGPRHMPIWGYEFFGAEPDDELAHREATAKIDALVRFLQSIQRTR